MFGKNLKTTAQEVFLLLEKTHTRMGCYGGDLKNEFMGAVFEAVCTYELETLKDAMSEFEKLPSSQMRSFPRLGDIVEKVKEVHMKKNKNLFSAKEYCEYYEEKESLYSKSLCKKEVSYLDAKFSKEIFNRIFCIHHQKRCHAIQNKSLEESKKFINDMREGEKIRIKAESMPVGFDDFGNKLEWVEFHKKYVIEDTPIENFFVDVKNGKFASLDKSHPKHNANYAKESTQMGQNSIIFGNPCDGMPNMENPVKQPFLSK